MTSQPIDLNRLRPLLAKYQAQLQTANGRSRPLRTYLLPLLHEAQALYGWLPEEVQQQISQTLRVPLADIHGVIEFYTMFYNEPTAPRVIRVCESPSCQLNGATAVMEAIEQQTGLQHGQTNASLTYEKVPCLGMCEHAPCALDHDKPVGHLTPADVPAFLRGDSPEPTTTVYGRPLLALQRVGKIDPTSLNDYLAHGGYAGLRKAINAAPDALITAQKESKILGRGGAMFPLGLKAQFVRDAAGSPAEKHIVANADESEPGTFKDRVILEEDPFSLIEAMSLLAYAIGAENGWIFVRGEYPRAYGRLANAITQARQAGYLGRDILGQDGFHFDIELRLGAGAYICGEETALFEAIEGKRGFPRIKPPYPPSNGLFGQPTAINNVETLVMALAAFNVGHEAWHELGTKESPGTKLFCVSGHVARPGTYELPFGVTIRELLAMAGGVPDGKAVQALLVGGAAGVFVGPDKLDMPLTYEDAKAHGVPLGSGAIMVFDETADLRQTLYHLAHFFAHESCGKCYPCQMGTQRQMEILHHLAAGQSQPTAETDLLDLTFTMTQTSLCGLGQTAGTAVASALKLWPTLLT